MDFYLFLSHLLWMTHDCDRPVSTPSNSDQETLRNLDAFRPPFTAKSRNCFNVGSSDKRDRSVHSKLHIAANKR